MIEADGGIGHGNKVFGSNEIDTDGIKRDKIKDRIAQEHNMQVIRIDCNYQDDNKYQYIKEHVLNSELNNIFDLSCIDWNRCHSEALFSLVYESAKLYNDDYSVGDISRALRYNTDTIRRWLKQATDIGLCKYSKEESRKRGRRVLFHAVNQYTKDNKFVRSYPSLVLSEMETGASPTAIANCCKKKKYFYTAGGYQWFDADDPDQPDKSKIISNNTKLMKEA